MSEIVFVGTGDAFNSGGRRNSAIGARAGHPILLDCGPTLGGLKELGIDPLEIDAIALSHFHGDHIAGVPFLLLDYCTRTSAEAARDPRPAGRRRLRRPLTRVRLPPERERRYALRFLEFAVDKPTRSPASA
jgi:ribonuclease BN (tRNA processing enzyme)